MKRAALTQAIDEAWAMLAVLTVAAIAALVFLRSRAYGDRFGKPTLAVEG